MALFESFKKVEFLLILSFFDIKLRFFGNTFIYQFVLVFKQNILIFKHI